MASAMGEVILLAEKEKGSLSEEDVQNWEMVLSGLNLDELRPAYRLALVSDAQPCYALPEIKEVGLDGYFDPIILSAHYGFRKPDKRLTEIALEIMKLKPAEVICAGNDMYRDIYGASRLGIKTIFIDSNQGDKSHENVTPDYHAHRFEDVLRGVEALR